MAATEPPAARRLAASGVAFAGFLIAHAIAWSIARLVAEPLYDPIFGILFGLGLMVAMQVSGDERMERVRWRIFRWMCLISLALTVLRLLVPDEYLPLVLLLAVPIIVSVIHRFSRRNAESIPAAE